MPQRMRRMHNDTVHVPITTGGAAILYGWTMQEIVLVLWAAYVVVLIVTKLPEFTASVVRIHICLQGHWAKLKGWWSNEK